MVGPTQAEIDNAVMMSKNATYKLAYELSLESKHGGVIDCCVTKLKLLWMYERALECHLEYQNANGTIEISVIPAGTEITILIDGEAISGVYTRTTANQASEMILLTANINAFQDDYVAVFDSTLGTMGKIVVTGPDCTDAEMTATVVNATVVVTDLVGVCADNCLTDEDAKKLIAKIKSMCNITN